jgi:Ser/Thr protein kinase RdoA (MazF antagonist)
LETPINPNFTPSEAEDLLYHKYGKKFKAEVLPSYIDQNFKVKDESGVKYIFKIFNREEDELFVDATVKILNYLTINGFKGKTPEIVPTTNGEDCFNITGTNGYSHKALLLSYLEGTFLVDVKTHSEALINNLGSFMGRLDRTLSNFSYPGLNRIQYWDIKNAHHISDKIKYISNLEQRRIADYFLFQFETSVLPKLRKCRESVIHNDANDYNLLVKEDAITGRRNGFSSL